MISKWQFKKNIRREEYQYMVGQEEERKTSSNKRTKFLIGKRPVKRAKLERFKREHTNLEGKDSCE